MKSLTGKVISDKMQMTAVVAVERQVAHPVYTKRMKRTQKFHADNSIGGKTGQTVVIQEVKRAAKTKAWKITEVIKNGTA